MKQDFRLEALLQAVEDLEKSMIQAEEDFSWLVDQVHAENRLSAKNLIHYNALRSVDLRSLQNALSAFAISSHGHAEGYALQNLYNIKRLLLSLLGRPADAVSSQPDMHTSRMLLQRNTDRMFGRADHSSTTRVMVTLPTEAAADQQMVRRLIRQGMEIARINTAHDDETTWYHMVQVVREQAAEMGRNVFIYMDLAGPKIRTRLASEQADRIRLTPGLQLFIAGEGSDSETAPDLYMLPSSIAQDVRPGERIWFDDGKFGGVITSTEPEGFHVSIDHCPPSGGNLKNEKGVNLPDTLLDLPAITNNDLEHLPFICRHADMIGYSFVRSAEDVSLLQDAVHELTGSSLPLILKIENKEAFSNLTSLILQGMKQPQLGLMIARGDLAVELGFLRMAEVQEEIMWMGEAAHIPVIWATQVLESLVKKGRSNRAEVSDAVKAVRAECVMLNKGPYIEQGIRRIMEIDKVMSAHEDKKQRYMRPLNIASNFFRRAKPEPHLL